jgi:hypothetical protein
MVKMDLHRGCDAIYTALYHNVWTHAGLSKYKPQTYESHAHHTYIIPFTGGSLARRRFGRPPASSKPRAR